MSEDLLATWLCALSPERGPGVAQAIKDLPLRPVYPWLEGGDDPRPFSAEWSVRAHSEGVDRARMMIATDVDQCPSGLLDGALRSIGETPRPLRDLAENLLAQRKDLDLLLGFDLGEEPPRSKLYVLRPAGRPVEDFTRLCEEILTLAGVQASWTRRQVDRAGSAPAFLAVDLWPGGRATGKIYFSFQDPADVDSLLETLGCEELRIRLAQVHSHVSDNPVGRLVVTTRGLASDTLDVTLHAHLASLPELDSALDEAWSELQAQGRQLELPPLCPSYISWLSGPRSSESLYYTFGNPSD